MTPVKGRRLPPGPVESGAVSGGRLARDAPEDAVELAEGLEARLVGRFLMAFQRIRQTLCHLYSPAQNNLCYCQIAAMLCLGVNKCGCGLAVQNL